MRFFVTTLESVTCIRVQENSPGQSGPLLILPVHQPAVYVDGWDEQI